MRSILRLGDDSTNCLIAKNRNRTNKRVFSATQIRIRSLPIRLLALCLTASFGVFVDQSMSGGANSLLDQPVIIPMKPVPLEPSLVIKSIPAVTVPESLRHMENLDFWVFTTADLDSQGLVKNIIFNFGNATTFKEQSRYYNLPFQVNDHQRRSINRELAETLVSQISQIKFEPALNDGLPSLSHIVVSTHFRSINDGTNRKWEVETRIESRDAPGMVMGCRYETFDRFE